MASIRAQGPNVPLARLIEASGINSARLAHRVNELAAVCSYTHTSERRQRGLSAGGKGRRPALKPRADGHWWMSA